MHNHPLFFSGPTLLTPEQRLADLKQRAARAAASTFRNRQSGAHEQYLASYFLLEALDAQLASLQESQHPKRVGGFHA